LFLIVETRTPSGIRIRLHRTPEWCNRRGKVTFSQPAVAHSRLMDRPFLILVGVSSLATFGGVLFLTAPAAPGHPAAAASSGAATSAASTTAAAAAAPAAPAATPAAVESKVYYAGCNEVRDLGKAPLYRGQPGYRIGMDGDNDGIACEPHRDDGH
jgi:hypothetical protein